MGAGLSRRSNQFRQSATIRMSALARMLRAQGKQVLDLSIGEPDFNTPEHICEAACRAAREGYTHYPPVAGFHELREAVAVYTGKITGVSYEVEHVLVTAGAKQALSHLFQVLADPGDEVLIPAPCWVSYPDMAIAAGLKPILIPTSPENEFKLSAETLEEAIEKHTRAKILVINTPCNPTGAVYDDRTLREIAELIRVKAPHIWVVSDEVYDRLIFEGEHVSIARYLDPERVCVVNSCSKAYAMTGWRVGWLVGPAEVVKKCEFLQGQTTAGACSVSQRAAIAALTGPQDFVYKMRRVFHRRTGMAVDILSQLPEAFKPFKPAGTFYVWVSVEDLINTGIVKDGDELAEKLLKEIHVSVVGGNSFGDPGAIRLSCAASDETIFSALNRVLNYLDDLLRHGERRTHTC